MTQVEVLRRRSKEGQQSDKEQLIRNDSQLFATSDSNLDTLYTRLIRSEQWDKHSNVGIP